MLPLAQVEIESNDSTFLSQLYDGTPQAPNRSIEGENLIQVVLRGGYPEVVARSADDRRRAWLRAYLNSVLTRDLRDIADIEKLTELPRFVSLVAEHSGQLVNYSQFGAGIGVSHKTAQRYLGLLGSIFVTTSLRPWFTNAVSRVVKSPKIHFLDSGLLATTRGLTLDRLRADRRQLGPLLETFVLSEIVKLEAGSDFHLTPSHFRDGRDREVDIVLERDDGAIVGLEVKASATVTTGDFKGLRRLAEAAGDRFVFGAVLYDGADVVHFGDQLAAVPLSSLWG